MPEQSKLYLPSDLPRVQLRLSTSQNLANMEARLRFAQSFDALSGLRRSLAVKAELSQFKKVQVRGQHASTRARGLLDSAEDRISMYTARYRRTRAAYMALVGPGTWESTLKVLADNDIRTLSAHQDEAQLNNRTGRREGYRTVSWIYMSSTAPDELHTGPSTHFYILFSLLMISSGLRVEWLKSKARRDRWQEEVELLNEEIERTETFFRASQKLWMNHLNSFSRHNLPLDLAEGLSAYACRQADIQDRRVQHMWKLSQVPKQHQASIKSKTVRFYSYPTIFASN